MQFEGTVKINALSSVAWDFLTDPNEITACVPQIESWQEIEPNKRFELVGAMPMGVGNFARVPAVVNWLEVEFPKMSIESKVKFGSGQLYMLGAFELEETADNQTNLIWSADIREPKTGLSIPKPMLHGWSVKLFKHFFTCVKNKIEAV